MQGSRGYCDLFTTGQYGRLYISVGSHARGSTFHIWVLPENLPEKWTRIHEVPDAVEVYGVTGGQPGWTETYGWLHTGKWQEDFEMLVTQKIFEKNERMAKRMIEIEAQRLEAIARRTQILETYK